MTGPRIALTTYSVKPRGGVVHTLELAEALCSLGVDVTVVAMGDPSKGFFRPVDAPIHIIEAPEWAPTLEERVFSWIDSMTAGFDPLGSSFDIVHAQDCISARAAAHVRDASVPFTLVRTVHHVDDFHTPALIDCQRKAIEEPDTVLVVSELWRRRLSDEYQVSATVVTNGVRPDRFAKPITDARRDELRDGIGAADRFLFLTVGGIEPRKGSEYLIEALALLKDSEMESPALAVIGGHSFQDYRAYRERVLGSLDELGLDTDVVLLGTVDDAELVEWYQAADGFVFPSISEGWGLVILEAMSAGLPVVASDIEVFEEFLTADRDAVLTRAADPASLAKGMARLRDDEALAARLSERGPALANEFSWERTARQHAHIYRALESTPASG